MASRKPDEGGFGKFLYNSDTGEVLGRTGSSWLKIIVFYIFFYAALAGFFGACLYIFYLTLDPANPKYKQDASLIGTNPGIGFRPQPDQEHNVDSTLIWVSSGDSQFWSNQLKTYTQMAKKATEDDEKNGKKLKECSWDSKDTKATKSQACKIPLDAYGPCTEKNEFGYAAGEPCVLIKLNRIIEWEPKLLRGGNKKVVTKDGNTHKLHKAEFLKALGVHGEDKEKELPLPAALIDMIDKQLTKDGKGDPAKEYDIARSIWIYCDGENPADKENIGQITYYPMAGIPSFYFPFNKQPHYISPYIMVQFNRVIPGVLINLECKAFGGNIYQDRVMRLGSVHFELMVEHAKPKK